MKMGVVEIRLVPLQLLLLVGYLSSLLVQTLDLSSLGPVTLERLRSACEDDRYLTYQPAHRDPMTIKGWKPFKGYGWNGAQHPLLHHYLQEEVLRHFNDPKLTPNQRISDFNTMMEGLQGIDLQLRFGDGYDSFLHGYHAIETLWHFKEGHLDLSPSLTRLVMRYLARDRSRPLSEDLSQSILDIIKHPGHWNALNVDSKLIIVTLTRMITNEDHGFEPMMGSQPGHLIAQMNPIRHAYLKVKNDPFHHRSAFIKEALRHLQDKRAGLWDRIVTYEAFQALQIDLSSEEAYLRIRNPTKLDRALHSISIAASVSRSKSAPSAAEAVPMEDLLARLHTLDRTQVMDIERLRESIEKFAKKTSSSEWQMDYLDDLYKVLLSEHYPQEESNVRMRLYNRIKRNRLSQHPRLSKVWDRLNYQLWSHQHDQDYVKILKGFSKDDPKLLDRCLDYLVSGTGTQLERDDILDIIHHINKYDFLERSYLRKQLQETTPLMSAH